MPTQMAVAVNDEARPPAIVLGRSYTALGALRSLAMAGIPACVACPVDDLATRSRWYRPLPGSGWDGTISDTSVDQLRAAAPERAVLIAGADDAALWLAGLAENADLARHFAVSTSSVETLRILQDKRRFGEFLHGTGIAHPPTYAIDSATDIDAIPFERLDRVFLKPVDSQRFSEATGHKAVWPGGRDNCRETWQRLTTQGHSFIAQEYIPGGADQHYFIDGFRDRGGRITGLLARRRMRIHPPDFGNSSYCETIALSQVDMALEGLHDLLQRLCYRGIFSAEFKRDPRDGSFPILEVNTRAWWYVEFAARCGVNVCEMAYCDALGLPVPTAKDYPAGIGCISLVGDIRAVLAQPAATRVPLRHALRQWHRGQLHAFRWDDPMPGLSLCWQFLRNRLRRMFS